MAIAVVIIQLFICLSTGLYVVLFRFVAPFGIIAFYLLSGACAFVALAGLGAVGHDLARQRDELQAQLEIFDATAASCFSENDREQIYAQIRELYFDIDSFNCMVRTKLKDYVLLELQLPEVMLPYRTAVVGIVIPTTVFSSSVSAGTAMTMPIHRSRSPCTWPRFGGYLSLWSAHG